MNHYSAGPDIQPTTGTMHILDSSDNGYDDDVDDDGDYDGDDNNEAKTR